MSRKGNCYDNAYIESFWSSLKYEVVFTNSTFATRDEARTAVFHYIETYYNRVRLHSSLGYLSPINFESQPDPQLKALKAARFAAPALPVWRGPPSR